MRKTELLVTWVEEFTQRIESVNNELQVIDARGAFEADDEVGFFFQELKEIGKILDNLFEEVEDASKEEEKKEE